jgi:hypothetical protein
VPYVDPNTVHNPATGTVAPAAWGDTIRDDLEFLIDPPAVSFLESTAQSISNVTSTVMTGNEETFDTDGMHSNVTDTSRITCQTAGRYDCNATLRFAGSTGGTYRQIIFRVNGTTSYPMNTVAPVNDAAVETIVSANKKFVLAAGDYVEVLARHNAGGAINCNLDEFAATYITR